MYDPNDAKCVVWAFFDVANGLETRLTRLKPRLILIVVVLPLIPLLLVRCPCHCLRFGTRRGGGVRVRVWMVVVVMWRCGV